MDVKNDPPSSRRNDASDERAQGKSAEPMNSRWWENYLVRYFIGAIVGCVVLAVLLNSVLQHEAWYRDYIDAFLCRLIDGAEVSISSALIVIFGLAGLCYCYVASAPITVFHAARMLKGGDPLGIPPTVMWSWWMGLGALALVAQSLLADSVPLDYRGYIAAIWMALPAVYVLISQIVKIAQLVSDFPGEARRGTAVVGSVLGLFGMAARTPPGNDKSGAFEKFYYALAWRRTPSVGQQHAADYRASYTHLREHSNSVFIVLLEISFGALIWLLVSNQSDLAGRLGAAAIAICIWLAPNIYLWGQANRLEAALQDGRLADALALINQPKDG